MIKAQSGDLIAEQFHLQTGLLLVNQDSLAPPPPGVTPPGGRNDTLGLQHEPQPMLQPSRLNGVASELAASWTSFISSISVFFYIPTSSTVS